MGTIRALRRITLSRITLSRITLTRIGIIVGIGVLVDSLPVRTANVPTLAVITDERFW